jgi:hypothetical protein
MDTIEQFSIYVEPVNHNQMINILLRQIKSLKLQ